MGIWWASLTVIQKIFWTIAIFSSVLFLLRTILTFIGTDHSDTDSDVDVHTGGDVDGEAAHLPGAGYFTIRNMVGFFLGFSWGGLACINSGLSTSWSVICGSFIGLFFMLVIMSIMKAISRLKSSGTVLLQNAVGQEATVSIVIPGSMNGKGKVSLSLQGRLIDIESVTEGEEIKPGQKVMVKSLSGTQLVVEKTKH